MFSRSLTLYLSAHPIPRISSSSTKHSSLAETAYSVPIRGKGEIPITNRVCVCVCVCACARTCVCISGFALLIQNWIYKWFQKNRPLRMSFGFFQNWISGLIRFEVVNDPDSSSKWATEVRGMK